MHELFHYGRDFCVSTADNRIFWISIISAVITFFAVLVALFKDWILSYILKPKLVFKTSPSIMQKFGGESYRMYRLLIINNGAAVAQDVRALISGVSQPLYLLWTNIDKINRDISRNEPAYLDVIQEKNGKLYFYPWGDIIDSEDYCLSGTEPTIIKIDFFEKNLALQSATLKLNPVDKTLEVVL